MAAEIRPAYQGKGLATRLLELMKEVAAREGLSDLLAAIRNDKPYNEVERGVKASVVSNMGRFAAHTAQEVTFDDMLNHEHEYCPNADKLTMDSEPPVKADKDGKYPVPEPGIVTKTEWKVS